MNPVTARSRPTTIRQARHAAGLTLEGLAQAADCSLAYVRTVEAGGIPANPEAAPAYQRILSVLNVETPDLTRGLAKSSEEGARRDEH